MDLQKYLKNQLVEGDTWYLIHCDQPEQCKKSLVFKEIDNATLFGNNDPSDIHENMIEGIDYALVPEEGWNLLVEKFGLKEGQNPIGREF